jgi:glycosyltransferase involved in cell wall biosynthesis
MNPFFSIIIPVYNSQKYFKICLDSVLRQNFNNYEILIINDASRDGSKKICNDFQKISSKIRIIENKKNLGVSISRNKGIKNATGKYILFLDSDDILLSGSLKKLYQHILLKKSNIVALDHNELKNNYKGSVKRESESKGFFKKKTFSKNKIQLINLVENFKLFNPLCYSFSINRNFILKNKIFFENIRMHEDHLFVSKLFYSREKASYPEIVTHSRRSTSLESLGRTVGYEVCISSAKNLFFYLKDYKKTNLKIIEKKSIFGNLKFFTKKFFLNLLICSKKDLLNLNKFINNSYPTLLTDINKIIIKKKLLNKKNPNIKKWNIIVENFLKKLENEFGIKKEKKINIFCSSAYSKICIKLLKNNYKISINAVFDNNKDFQNQKIENIRIKSINKHIEKNIKFLVCNLNENDFKNIKNQLMKLKVPSNKIIKFDILKNYKI